MSDPSYAGGEGPADYDPEQVARLARQQDPGLPMPTALSLARAAWRHIQAGADVDVAEIARRLLADDPAGGASPAAVVARAAVEFCEEYGVKRS